MSFGINISKEGFDAKTEPTSTNKKNYQFLSEDNSPKVYYAGFLTAPDIFTGVSYTHDLGYVPMFFLYAVDSVSTPTYYTLAGSMATASTTNIEAPFVEYGYLVILLEGNE